MRRHPAPTAANTVTLRIKRVYFDRILSGEKTREWRDAKPFYARLFEDREEPVRFLLLHYQRERRLLVEVRRIRRVPTPSKLHDTGIPFGPEVYCIFLGGCRLL